MQQGFKFFKWVVVMLYFTSWFLTLSGLSFYLSVVFGITKDPNYAFVGVIMVSVGAIITGVIDYFYFMIGGMRWHTVTGLIAAALWYLSLTFLYQLGVLSNPPLKVAFIVVLFLGFISILRVLYVRFFQS